MFTRDVNHYLEAARPRNSHTVLYSVKFSSVRRLPTNLFSYTPKACLVFMCVWKVFLRVLMKTDWLIWRLTSLRWTLLEIAYWRWTGMIFFHSVISTWLSWYQCLACVFISRLLGNNNYHSTLRLLLWQNADNYLACYCWQHWQQFMIIGTVWLMRSICVVCWMVLGTTSLKQKSFVELC